MDEELGPWKIRHVIDEEAVLECDREYYMLIGPDDLVWMTCWSRDVLIKRSEPIRRAFDLGAALEREKGE